jgi:3-hydroxyacyl-CoA dehydrogenase/enoyl-CoA hydratase/3-hydroxybutyryl-CoA epimerase
MSFFPSNNDKILIDEVGLDIGKKVESVLTDAYGERMRGSGILGKLVEAGMLGKKNGKGFYIYGGEKPLPNVELKDFGVNIIGNSSLSDEEILDRLINSMASEAKICYEEGVAGVPSEEAAFQIDLASIMGFGFPPFLGGIMYNSLKKTI